MDSKVKAVIFDLDGTLTDTEKYYQTAWPKALEHFGYTMEKEKALDAGLYTSIEEELADQVTPQEEIEFQEYLENEVEEEAARLLEMLGGDEI